MHDQFKKGESCLNTDGENCKSYFKKSIAAAKKIKSDTLDLHRIKLVADAYKTKGGHLNDRIEFCKKGIALAKEKNNTAFEWDFQLRAGETYLLMSEFDKMETSLGHSLRLARNSKDSYDLSMTFFLKAQLLMSTARYPDAVKAALEGKKYALKTNNQRVISRGYDILASTYFYNDDYELSAKYIDKTRLLYLEVGDTLNAMYCLTNWCNIQSELGNAQNIVDRLPVAIEYFERLKLHTRVVFPQAQLGKAYNSLGKFETAIALLEDAYSQSVELGLDQQAAYCATLLSDSYIQLNNPEKSLEYSTVAFEYHKGNQVSQEYLSTHRKHADALMQNGSYEDAAGILVNYIESKDSVFNESKMQEIAQLQEQYETKLKNEKILRLEKEKETIKNRNIGLTLGLILTAIIAWLLIKRKSIKMRLKQAENDKMDAEIQNKNRELTSQALHLAQKNELLTSLKNDLGNLPSEEMLENVKYLEQKIKFDEQIDQNWEQFTTFFTRTRSEFFKNITKMHPAVGKSDLRMSALLSMNLDSKEIASILNISSDGVKKARYRLRKKLELQSKDDLASYLAQF